MDFGKIPSWKGWPGTDQGSGGSTIPENVKKTSVDVAPGDIVSAERGSAGLMAGLEDLGGLFQPW